MIWYVINNVTRKAEKSHHSVDSFKMNNREVSRVKSAEAFNNWFLNMVDDLQIQTDNDISHIALVKNNYQNDFSQMYIIPVTEGEIQSLMCSLKAKIQVGVMEFQQRY